jgi:hypothetical protein
MSLALPDVDACLIPDLIEPVGAWRVWRVGMCEGRVVLESLFGGAGTVWEPGVPLAAVCSCGHRPRWRPWRIEPNEHSAPDLDCSCGIYGVPSVSAARSYLETPALVGRNERVIGRVALWGSVVEGPFGWRASRAYPIELFVPAPAITRSAFRRRAYVEEIVLALEAYRVPVDLFEPSALAVVD